MSDKCERCRRGFVNSMPKDDVEWITDPPGSWKPGIEDLFLARCKRCGAILVDRWSTDREREGVETHDVCTVMHESARAALTERRPLLLAAVSSQLRRRHVELLIGRMPMEDTTALDRIEKGQVECTEVFRGLVTHAAALARPAAPIGDVRPKRSSFGSSATPSGRVRLDLDGGARVLLEPVRDKWTLARMRGDAAEWRIEIDAAGREAHAAIAEGRDRQRLVVLVAPAPGDESGRIFIVEAETGALRGAATHRLRAAPFEARALANGCIFLATYQRFAIVRSDATLIAEGAATAMPPSVATDDGVIYVDAPWRLVALELPSGHERWSVPVDRGTSVAAASSSHVFLSTLETVARVNVGGSKPRVQWVVSGHSPMPLSTGGVAVVRERSEKSSRRIECVSFSSWGERTSVVPRPDATKAPVAEIGADVLLFHVGGDVAVTVGERVVYALSLPDRRTVQVTTDVGGAWIEYDGRVDRIGSDGQRVGRWSIG